ncbi:MAG TPA: Nif3-like dinuclear metal center hexameric protein [Bacillota bacterium]|nr:Nif3-like dinuclear metal center hexameric protein [Bacillota bacterium]HPT66888.1 Nif3-like dinuclear metal center hexameric protein [Bacillota bacterium]
MDCKVSEIIKFLEDLAPANWAEEWDNCGLLLGNKDNRVEKVLVALEATRDVLAEAQALGANFVVTHHPLYLKPIRAIHTNTLTGGLISSFLKADIALYAMHTNYDRSPQGLNDYLGRLLGLRRRRPLETPAATLYKLVVYVPKDHTEAVAAAMTRAGAGHIGQYSDCTFRVEGTGTFRPQEGTNPYIGQTGQLELVAEVRLETVVPAHLRSRVIAAMLAAHPYEEVAYDLYSLAEPKGTEGLGCIGDLASATAWPDLLRTVKEQFGLAQVRVGGAKPPAQVKTLAVTGGSGAGLLQAVARAGAEVYLTGDIKYHDYRLGEELGVCLVDIGHFNSESLGIQYICEYLRATLAKEGKSTPVISSQVLKSPFYLE